MPDYGVKGVSDELLRDVRKQNSGSGLADLFNVGSALLGKGRQVRATRQREAALSPFMQANFEGMNPAVAQQILRDPNFEPGKFMSMLEERRLKGAELKSAEQRAREQRESEAAGRSQKESESKREVAAKDRDTGVKAENVQRLKDATRLKQIEDTLKNGDMDAASQDELRKEYIKLIGMQPKSLQPGFWRKFGSAIPFLGVKANRIGIEPSAGPSNSAPSALPATSPKPNKNVEALAAAMSRGDDGWRALARKIKATPEDVKQALDAAGLEAE